MQVYNKTELIDELDNVYSFINSSLYKDKLMDLLYKTDIKIELDLVKAVMADGQTNAQCNVLDISFQHTMECIKNIHSELRKIQLIIDTHKKSYINWAEPDLSANMIRLQALHELLSKRRAILISTLFISKVPTRKDEPFFSRIFNFVRDL